MPRRIRSLKQEMDLLSAELRDQGLTWVEIAERFRQRWSFNPLQSFREAHRLTQSKVTDQWNSLWPDQPLTVRKLGAWEAWPNRTGNEPPQTALSKLARIYQCQAGDLVHGEDHRDADVHANRTQQPALVTGAAINPAGLLKLTGIPAAGSDSPLSAGELRDTEFDQLTQALAAWAAQMNRRDVLAMIGAAATAAYASPLLDRLNDDELHRISQVAADPARVDEATIGHIEAVLHHCRRQEDTLGPRAVLETVLAQHQLVRSLLPAAPEALQERLWSLLANICRSMGWMLFNLNDFRGADYYFAQARTAAHEADDDAMNSFVLANWSQLATWRGDARQGVEHALGALAWGQRAGSKLLTSYAYDVGARAYAAVVRRSSKGDRRKDHSRCMRSLDAARRELTFADEGDEGSALLHFYDEGLHDSTRTLCLLDLDDTTAALPLAQQSIIETNPAFTRNLAYTRLYIARAHTQSRRLRDIQAACEQIGQAAGLTLQNTSPRLVASVLSARQELSPWNATKDVRDLDERLIAYQLTA
jgi:hypothetical protein